MAVKKRLFHNPRHIDSSITIECEFDRKWAESRAILYSIDTETEGRIFSTSYDALAPKARRAGAKIDKHPVYAPDSIISCIAGGIPKASEMPEGEILYAYTDGSLRTPPSSGADHYGGYGVYMKCGDRIAEFAGSALDNGNVFYSTGFELMASTIAMKIAMALGYKKLVILYDAIYVSIDYIKKGNKKSQNMMINEYLSFWENIVKPSGIDVSFQKVKAHIGELGNEHANLLATSAACALKSRVSAIMAGARKGKKPPEQALFAAGAWTTDGELKSASAKDAAAPDEEDVAAHAPEHEIESRSLKSGNEREKEAGSASAAAEATENKKSASGAEGLPTDDKPDDVQEEIRKAPESRGAKTSRARKRIEKRTLDVGGGIDEKKKAPAGANEAASAPVAGNDEAPGNGSACVADADNGSANAGAKGRTDAETVETTETAKPASSSMDDSAAASENASERKPAKRSRKPKRASDEEAEAVDSSDDVVENVADRFEDARGTGSISSEPKHADGNGKTDADGSAFAKESEAEGKRLESRAEKRVVAKGKRRKAREEKASGAEEERSAAEVGRTRKKKTAAEDAFCDGGTATGNADIAEAGGRADHECGEPSNAEPMGEKKERSRRSSKKKAAPTRTTVEDASANVQSRNAASSRTDIDNAVSDEKGMRANAADMEAAKERSPRKSAAREAKTRKKEKTAEEAAVE